MQFNGEWEDNPKYIPTKSDLFGFIILTWEINKDNRRSRSPEAYLFRKHGISKWENPRTLSLAQWLDPGCENAAFVAFRGFVESVVGGFAHPIFVLSPHFHFTYKYYKFRRQTGTTPAES